MKLKYYQSTKPIKRQLTWSEVGYFGTLSIMALLFLIVIPILDHLCEFIANLFK